MFDGSEPSLIVVDDHMSDINQVVADIFTKISHHRNISILHLTQNLFDENKYARTISLNAHHLVLFKNPRDASQFATLARQMYPNAMEVEQHIRKLETLATLLVEYINCYNINNAVKANHLQLLSVNRDEALHRNGINYEVRNHVNHDDEMAEDEIDGTRPE